jgi:wee1-like protein kinase
MVLDLTQGEPTPSPRLKPSQMEIYFSSQSQSQTQPALTESQTEAQSQQENMFVTPSESCVTEKTDQELTEDLMNSRYQRIAKDPFHIFASTMPNPFIENALAFRKRNRDVDRQEGLDRLHWEFDVIERRGRGSFGEVWKCRKYLDGCLYAVKALNAKIRGESHFKQLMNEVWVLSALNQAELHPVAAKSLIIQYFDSWVENQTIYIQTEYCSGKDLNSSLEDHFHSRRKFEPMFILMVLYQMSFALQALHTFGVAHLDVKPANILQKSENTLSFRLVDFGIACSLKNGSSSGYRDREGDCRYLCPEILEENFDHLEKADMYSLGASILELSICRPLPQGGIQSQLLMEFMHCEGLPQRLKELVLRMLSPSPNDRPTSKQVNKESKEILGSLTGGFNQ